MKFFHKSKKDNSDNLQSARVEENAKQNCDTAIRYAKSFEKDFDFSRNSIKDLEEILDYYSKDISRDRPTEHQIWSMSIIFGSYLGEVMLKNGLSEKGYKWGIDNTSDIPLLINAAGNYITPNDKVYKRLVNGAEDNVLFFYDAIMEMA